MPEQEIELDRKIAKNWREYLSETTKMKNMIVWVWKCLMNKDGRRLTFIIFCLMSVSAIISVLNPATIGSIINSVKATLDSKENTTTHSLINGLLILIFLLSIRRITEYLKGRSREFLFRHNHSNLNSTTSRLFFEKSLGMHIKESKLLNESIIKKGHERVAALQETIIFDGLEVLLSLSFSFCAAWLLSPKLGLLMLAVGIMHISWSLFLNQRMFRDSLPIDKKWRYLTRYRTERWERVERVKTNCKVAEEMDYMDNFFDETCEEDGRFWLWFIKHCAIRGALSYLIGWFVAIIYGIYLVRTGEMTLGWIYPWITYSTTFIDNLWRVGDLEQKVNFFTPAILSFKKGLELPLDLYKSANTISLPKDSPNKIEFINVCYDFENAPSINRKALKNPPVLSNVSFTIEPGEKIALIGPTGVGKSTIIKLLLRFMDPTSGKILIDGVDLRELDLDSWLSRVGYIPQDQQIMNGTVRYNMTYGLTKEEATKISDDDIWKVMRSLQIDFGTRLADGLDTKIGYGGIDLSGGQKQRLMIGAAAMKNPLFMAIDEATSSLDATTEKLVQDGLEHVLRNRGALIVTHRLNTVRRVCDRFIVIDSDDAQGSQVVADGNNFEELAIRSAKFRELAKDQGINLLGGDSELLETSHHHIDV